MANYYYSNTAIETTLASNITSAATSLTVTAVTGFPTSFPYVLAIGYGATDEELAKVTNASGTTLTVERAFGGTSAQSHSLGATVRHVYNAQDATDFRTHEITGADIHGVTGEIVGTGDVQTLANKTLTAPTVNAGALTGTFTGAPTLSGDVIFSGNPSFTGNPTFTGGPVFNAANAAATMFKAPAATDVAYQVEVTGDAHARLQVGGDATMYWSDGTASADVQIGRRDSSDGLGTGLLTKSTLWFERGLAGNDIIDSRVTGDAGVRYAVDTDGSTYWGDGTSTTLDCALRRTGAGAMEMVGTLATTVETSTSFTMASGFSLMEASMRKTCGIATVAVYADVTTAIDTVSSTSPNIVDTPLGTLIAGYRPAYPMSAIWSTGVASGSALIGTDGVITLRTSDYDAPLAAGDHIRVAATFVL